MPTRAASTKPEKKFAPKRQILVTDSEGGLPLPVEWVREMGLKISDEFAAWKEGKEIIVVFPKVYRGKIPAHAHRGKIEPALPETIAALSKPAKAAKAKKRKVK